jgi:DNA-binding CsgD family transcriptional regulator
MGHILQTHEPRGFRSPGAQGTDDPRDHVATMSDLSPRPRHQTTMVHRDSAKVVSLLGVHDGTHRVIDSVAGDGPSAVALRGWVVQSLLLEAIMRDEIGDLPAAEQALERALELAEQDRVVLPFTVDPVRALLERYAGSHSTYVDLIAEIFGVLARHGALSPPSVSDALLEPLTGGEERVLRYLPTNLSKREIAQELYLSFHTIKTHMKHIYQKLDAHNRREAVERAREHGLLSSGSSSFALAS